MKSLWIRNTLWMSPLMATLLLAGCGHTKEFIQDGETDIDVTEQEAWLAPDVDATAESDGAQFKRLIREMRDADRRDNSAKKVAAGTERDDIYFVDPATGQPTEKIQTVRDLKKFSDDSWIVDGVFAERYPNGQVYQQGKFQEGRRVGEWKFWHPNGKVAKVVNYKNGLEDGMVIVYRADGTKNLVRSYKEGKKHGKWLSYDDTGEKENGQLEYKDDVRHGSSIDWYKTGERREEIQFKNGKYDGAVILWRKDGTKASVRHYKAGKRDGLDTVYNASGQKIREIRYKDGKVVPNIES